MLKVHHLEQSRSHRVLWLLEWLELEYEVVTYPRDAKTMLAPESLRQVHPLGKSPVLEDGDLVIAESGAIVDYVMASYGEHRWTEPTVGSHEWLNQRYWLHYAEGSLMPLLVMTLVFRTVPKKMPWWLKPIAKGICQGVQQQFLQPQIQRHGEFIEAHLARFDGQFAAQWPTPADIQMSFAVQAMAARDSRSNAPSIRAFLQKVEADPAWQRVVARVGPLSLLGD